MTDELYGEIEQTIASLRGESEELQNPDRVAYQDVAEQLEHRADKLEAAYEEFTDHDPDAYGDHDPDGEYAAKFDNRDWFCTDESDVVFNRAREMYHAMDSLTGDANVAVTIGPADAIQFPEVDQPYHDEEPTPDPYLSVLKSMQPGLLFTINDSPGARYATDELRVRYVDRQAPRVDATDARGDEYRIYEHPDRGIIVEEIDDEGYGGREHAVETVEILGID